VKDKPRIRVRARKEALIKVGGVGVAVSGLGPEIGDRLRALKCARIFKLEWLKADGDYDKYRVIYQ
jgi:hypothetical protein